MNAKTTTTTTTTTTVPACNDYKVGTRRTVSVSTVPVKEGLKIFLVFRKHKKLGTVPGAIGFVVHPLSEAEQIEQANKLALSGQYKEAAKVMAGIKTSEPKVYLGQNALLALQGAGGGLPVRLRSLIWEAIRAHGDALSEA